MLKNPISCIFSLSTPTIKNKCIKERGMDENRNFFRLKNKGDIQARYHDHRIEVIDISASSIAVNAHEELPLYGTIELKINLYNSFLNYELLRTTEDNISILIFEDRHQIQELFAVLKDLRKQRKE